jgi:hypothetical protein
VNILSKLILISSIFFSGCVPKSDYESAKAEIESLKARISTINQENAEQRIRIAQLEQKISRKPPMPVRVALRKALVGGGNIAVFSTTIKQDFPILVTVNSKALGTSKQIRVNLSGSGTTEVGPSDGLSIDSEDELTIENTNYETAKLRFR